MSSFQLTGYGSVLRMNQIGMCDKRAAVFRYIFNDAMVFILRDRFTEKQSINNDNSHKTKKTRNYFQTNIFALHWLLLLCVLPTTFSVKNVQTTHARTHALVFSKVK